MGVEKGRFSGPQWLRCGNFGVGLCTSILGHLGRGKKGGEPVLTRREPSERAGGYISTIMTSKVPPGTV